MKSLALVLLCLLSGAAVAQSPSSKTQLLVVFDDSGSMNEGNRLADAKKAFRDMLSSLRSMNSISGIDSVSLFPLNGREERASKYPFTSIEQRIDSMTADGGTPLASSIDRAAKAIESDDQHIVFVFTDGNADGVSQAVLRLLSIPSSTPIQFYFVEIAGGSGMAASVAQVQVPEALQEFRSLNSQRFDSSTGLRITSDMILKSIMSAGLRKSLGSALAAIQNLKGLNLATQQDISQLDTRLRLLQEKRADFNLRLQEIITQLKKTSGQNRNDSRAGVQRSVEGMLDLRKFSKEVIGQMSRVIDELRQIEERNESILKATAKYNDAVLEIAKAKASLALHKDARYSELIEKTVIQLDSAMNGDAATKAKAEAALALNARIQALKGDYSSLETSILAQDRVIGSEMRTIRDQLIARFGQEFWNSLAQDMAGAQIYFDEQTGEIVYTGTHVLSGGGAGSGSSAGIKVRNDGTLVILNSAGSDSNGVGSGGMFTNNGTIISAVSGGVGGTVSLFLNNGKIIRIRETSHDRSRAYFWGKTDAGYMVVSIREGSAYYISMADLELFKNEVGSFKRVLINSGVNVGQAGLFVGLLGSATAGVLADIGMWTIGMGTYVAGWGDGETFDFKRGNAWTQSYERNIGAPLFAKLASKRVRQTTLLVPQNMIPVLREIIATQGL